MLVTTATAEQALRRIEDVRGELYVDTETTGLRPYSGNRICGVSVDCGDEAFYFPFRHGDPPDPANLGSPVFADLIAKLHRLQARQIGWNYGFDMKMLLMDGLPLPERCGDVMLAAHLLNENEPTFALKPTADKYLGQGSSLNEQLLKDKLCSRGYDKGDMWRLKAEEVEPYACDDVRLTRKLLAFYKPHLEKWGLWDLWQELNDYLHAITSMESRGMQLDLEMLHRYSEEAKAKALETESVIQKLAGYPINVRSPKQLNAWLGTKSTALEVLESMADRPGVTELRHYRKWLRADSNYYRKFLQVMEANGLLHPNLHMTGTISGRLSASDPPLHAVPRDTDPDKIYKVKDVFRARPGNVMFEADYSQAELRVASHFANECNMAEKLERGADIHTETANETGMPRDYAKRVNFSVVYGIGYRTLAENLHITQMKAKEYLAKYHANYPGFKRLYNRAQAVAEHKGYIRLFSGRLRHFNCVEAPTHKASSNLVQGSVAEMTRVAIQRLHKLGIFMHLQIHDSIVGECKESEVKDVLPLVKRAMEDQAWCSVKHRVDFKVGPTWGLAKKVEVKS